MRIRKRLEHLERTLTLPERSCPACAHRKGLVAVVTKFSDGHTKGTEPEPCSVCGEVPEKLHILEIEIVPARRTGRLNHVY